MENHLDFYAAEAEIKNTRQQTEQQQLIKTKESVSNILYNINFI